jgi:hypothetical protein
MGMTATSWKRSMEKERWPASVFIKFFSFSVCRTMAVEDRDRMKADNRSPESPKLRRCKLKTDQEEHHDYAELGEVHDL